MPDPSPTPSGWVTRSVRSPSLSRLSLSYPRHPSASSSPFVPSYHPYIRSIPAIITFISPVAQFLFLALFGSCPVLYTFIAVHQTNFQSFLWPTHCALLILLTHPPSSPQASIEIDRAKHEPVPISNPTNHLPRPRILLLEDLSYSNPDQLQRFLPLYH